MTDNEEEEKRKIIEETLEENKRALEESVESCNTVRAMNYIRSIDQFSNMDSLTHYGVDLLKAIGINGQANEKVKELVDKFDKKCICKIR